MALTSDWTNFGVVVGGASAALTGLLFVAVSLNVARIVRHPALRATAGQTLVLFVVPLLTSIVLVVPAQPRWTLGVELIVLGLVAGLVLVVTGRAKGTGPDVPESRLANVLDRTSPNIVTLVFVELTGVTVLVGHGGGLYWLVPSAVLSLIGGVLNAWLFLTRVPVT
jgi:modulator of FtsH protease